MTKKGVVKLSVYISKNRKKLVERESKRLGLSQSQFMIYLVDRYFREEEVSELLVNKITDNLLKINSKTVLGNQREEIRGN